MNVIADMPDRHGEKAKALAASRGDDRARETEEELEEDSQAQREKRDLEADTRILERLSTIKALASRLRG